MANKDYKTIELAPKYIPKKNEEYMCVEQKAYFYNLLMQQKMEVENQVNDVLSSVRIVEKSRSGGVGDDMDNSNFEQEMIKELKLSQRNNNLLNKINLALDRLENGTFGYSVLSGDEIGILRMVARPLATLTIEEQEERESHE